MKKPQRQRILELFYDGRWHNTIEMNQIAYRYSAILHTLRKEGFVFEKKRDTRYPHNLIETWKLMGPYPQRTKLVLAPEGDRYIEVDDNIEKENTKSEQVQLF